jgi:imidazolonepropionase-like amidohydrolase
MMKHFLSYFPFFVLMVFSAYAQETFPVNGSHDKRPELYVFTNATVIVDYQTTIANGALIISKGKVDAVGTNLPIPVGAVVVDLKGKFIYPSMVDIYSDYGIDKPSRQQGGGGDFRASFFNEQYVTNKKGAYSWNEAVKPEVRGNEIFIANPNTAKALRDLGFGAVSTHFMDGIARGTGALVSLADDKEHDLILKGETAAYYAMNKGTSTQNYPSSMMGIIALLRQTFLDAQWYKTQAGSAEYNISLDYWNKNMALPQIIDTSNKLNVLRADKIGDEFGKQFIIKTAGDEYQRIADIKTSNAPLILTINFPDAYDVEDAYDAQMISLGEMKHWELAPTNPSAIAKAEIEFALTADGLKNKADFIRNIQKAIEYGLDKQTALKAITFTPAKLIGAESIVGSLKKGMVANFLITSKEIFDKENVIYENWVQGKKYMLTDMNVADIRGDYKLSVGGEPLTLKISGKADKPDFKVNKDTIKFNTSGVLDGRLLTLTFEKASKKVRLSGVAEGKLYGEGQDENGKWLAWVAEKTAEIKEETKKEDAKKEEKLPEMGKIIYPFTSFGSAEVPKNELILIKNATVWTNEKEGILNNTDVLLNNGKIEKIGQNLIAAGAKIIDGTGKHLTSGIIDEHSHIALNGTNEGVNSVSAEVRMGDVINSEDVNIYRQLSGGVIGAQLLHGSANPIGGQSGIVKFRWGLSPEQMKWQGADGFIKFALGENVKRSFGGGLIATARFPQTRMGVEQSFVDAFTRAREYEKNRISNPSRTRRDLQMEALAEILNKKRFITCHSYVQSEINMLMKVADNFGFKVNTFTHILEGYKVADKMAKHGAAGSSFADWWGYKYEVYDAIPQNPSLLTKAGVVTAINSDDAEMARRLNQEAAKSVKYTSMPEEDAWKMVTLNPAKMMHLDSKTGSIRVGKDADVVLWSDNPLSIYAKAEKTIIDGTIYFDIEKDLKLREEANTERNRLIQKMMIAKKGGMPTQRPSMRGDYAEIEQFGRKIGVQCRCGVID